MAAETSRLLIKGGRVYDHDGDIHQPPVADILIEGSTIAAVESNLPPSRTQDAQVIDAAGRLVVPGLINAHYHSHDVLCRGLFEELPLEFWLLYTLPMGANRSADEIRARTLVGALESVRCGITCVQDMLGMVPFADDYVDVVLKAYRDAGVRVVFSPMVSDIPPVAMVRYRELLPPDIQEMLGNKALGIDEQMAFLQHQIDRHPAEATLHWAVAPFAPQRCTPKLLEACQAFAEKHDLHIYTHVYETRGQRLIANDLFDNHQGSFIQYFANAGMLGPRLNIVHSVWIARAEMDRMAEADAGIVLNHLSNLKLKSGIAPVLDMRDSGVRLGLGCDNCSGSDVQNMFQAMKTFALFGAVSDPEPTPGLAAEALRYGTLGSARSAGLGDVLGAIKPGRKADMFLADTSDIAWLPFNSAARQLVYTETGRAIETVIIDGKPVMKDRRITTVDEDALRREVIGLMKRFIVDYDAVVKSRERALPHMLAAHRRVWSQDLPLQRFIARTR